MEVKHVKQAMEALARLERLDTMSDQIQRKSSADYDIALTGIGGLEPARLAGRRLLRVIAAR